MAIVPGFSYQSTFQWASENFHLNTFYATGFFLYPLKTLENLWFSGDTEKDQWYELPESMRKSRTDCPEVCGSCAFPQTFNTRKLGEITVFLLCLNWFLFDEN